MRNSEAKLDVNLNNILKDEKLHQPWPLYLELVLEIPSFDVAPLCAYLKEVCELPDGRPRFD